MVQWVCVSFFSHPKIMEKLPLDVVHMCECVCVSRNGLVSCVHSGVVVSTVASQ